MLTQVKSIVNRFGGLSFAVIGVLITLWIFWAQSFKEVSYTSETPSKIFDSTASSSAIQVLDQNGRIIKGNIFVTKAIIWNSGNVLIRSDEVRQPVTITISSIERILDYHISRENKQGKIICNADGIHSQDGSITSLKMTLDNFEPGFGCEVQIIYASNDKSGGSLLIDGYILGIESFHEGIERETSNFLKFIFLALFLVIPLIGFVMNYMQTRERLSLSTNLLILLFVEILVFILMIISSPHSFDAFVEAFFPRTPSPF